MPVTHSPNPLGLFYDYNTLVYTKSIKLPDNRFYQVRILPTPLAKRSKKFFSERWMANLRWVNQWLDLARDLLADMTDQSVVGTLLEWSLRVPKI